MKTFLTFYLVTAFLVICSVFLLSKHEGEKPYIKTVLTVVCIVAILAVIFAMTVLEGKYHMSRLYSSIIAAAAVGAIYGADRLGARLNQNNK